MKRSIPEKSPSTSTKPRQQAKSKKVPTPAVLMEEEVRSRAYQLYEGRGCEHGHAVEDWLQAETEMLSQIDAKSTA